MRAPDIPETGDSLSNGAMKGVGAMKCSLAETARDLGLRLPGETTSLQAALRGDRHAEVIELAYGAIDSGEAPREDMAALAVLARAATLDVPVLDARTAGLAAGWLVRDDIKKNFQNQMLFGAIVGNERPADLAAVLHALVGTQSDVTALVFALSGFLDGDRVRELLERLATHPLREVREHLLALLGKHRRLVPPGTIRYERIPSDALLSMVRSGIEDVDARVRERAIAACYGLGLVEAVRDSLIAYAKDEDVAVRQYALVALGAMRDPESRMVLLDRLRNGTNDEITSAIWALARRPDGVGDVLAMAGDSRRWVNDQLLHAFAEVAAPMSDQQLAELERKCPSSEFARFRARHIDRTRRGAPETGPDGRIEISVGAHDRKRD